MNKILFLIAVTLGSLTFIQSHSYAAGPYYENKTIRIIVGYSPGGGYDSYARAIARHMGKYIPGNPSIIVENMPGAGSLISANHLYRVTKPDGLTLGHFNGGLFFGQVIGQQGIEFDARKFEYIGAAVTGGCVALLRKASGITNVEKWYSSKRPIKMGGVVLGAYAPDNVTKVLKEALGLPIQLVTGYKGIAEIRLAAESGELDGAFGAWYGVRVSWRGVIESGDMNILMQAVPKSFSDLSNVPLSINLAKTETARQLIEAGVHMPSLFSWPFVLPPGTLKEQVLIIRKAFENTLKDSGFLAEAEKSKIGLDPVSGEELQKVVLGLFKTDPASLTKLKEIVLK